jgi:hypothetical protein
MRMEIAGFRDFAHDNAIITVQLLTWASNDSRINQGEVVPANLLGRAVRSPPNSGPSKPDD